MKRLPALLLALLLLLSACGAADNDAMRIHSGDGESLLRTITWDQQKELESLQNVLNGEEAALPERACDYRLEGINREQDGSAAPSTWYQVWIQDGTVTVYSEDTGNGISFGPVTNDGADAFSALLQS